MFRAFILWFFFAGSQVFADPPPRMVDAVPEIFRLIPADQSKLIGLFGQRLRANSEGFLEHLNTEELSALSNSAAAGTLLQAASAAYAYRRDPELKLVMDRIAKHLEASASSDDGVGLGGLLAYADITGDEEAFAISKRIGNRMVRNSISQPQGAQADPALIAPIIHLYRETDDENYLAFCKRAAARLLKETQDPSRIAELLFSLNGLATLYSITGEESYQKQILTAWQQIHSTYLTISGAPSILTRSSDAIPERACQLLPWFQLNRNLLASTGEQKYADELERTTYNDLLSAQDPKSGFIDSQLPAEGRRHFSPEPTICSSAASFALASIPSAIWGRHGNGIAVLFYSAGRATFQIRRQPVQLFSETTFPEEGNVLLHVEPSRNLAFPLRLRVPQWTRNFTAEIKGQRLLGKPGEFLIINRDWHKGDTVRISMEMPTIVHRSPEKPHIVALQRGPQLLAYERTLNGSAQDSSAVELAAVDTSEIRVALSGAAPPENFTRDPRYEVAGMADRKPLSLVFIPFADAVDGQVWVRTAVDDPKLKSLLALPSNSFQTDRKPLPPILPARTK